MTKTLKTSAFLILCSNALISADDNQHFSPDRRNALSVFEENGEIYYQLERDGKAILAKSTLGLQWGDIAPVWKVESMNTSHHNATWQPVFGKRENIVDDYQELQINLNPADGGKVDLTVIFRVYDEGIAYRYHLTSIDGENPNSELSITQDLSEFHFAIDGTSWSYNGERPNVGPETFSEIDGTRRLPTTVKSEQGYFSITEAQLVNFSWMDIFSKSNSTHFYCKIEPSTVTLPFSTPWRVLLTSDTPGGLIDASLVENLNPPAPNGEFEWVKPGVTFWDWRTWGYKTDDGFEYGLDMKSWKRFIDYASATNVPYLLLDANWYGKEFDPKSDPTTSRDHLVFQSDNGHIERKDAPADWKDPIDIPALIKYGNEKNVGIFLYINDKARINYDFENTLKTYQEWGAAGIKYGFMRGKGRQDKVNKTNQIIQLCAKYKLMCNFHDNPVMPSGDYRTWPNCTTREYCHAQADGKRSFSPTTFHTSIFVNMLGGPIDMNNGMFGLTDAHTDRPRVFQPIPSTIVGECARTLIVFSGQSIILDAPESYAEHPELFDFIANQSQPWLESRTLAGEIGEYAVMMRRNKDNILLAATTNEQARELNVDLKFLKAGQWTATIFQDAADAHFESNKEAYQSKTLQVSAEDTLELKLAPGGGACVKFTQSK
ncbi:glycoside hydrolase family 97 protein [Persicirhabdus sediminis]|uniref:Glycoside hydrolase family 97 catalytic domain-containing protein n=1 Tax=Persicirhabdus sediminis TaxID=454144 RepID=A0A8J7SK49_9BACT|nr:glycoside hydrolase family 97 protein [Persicirhabdus sediminis]MBK1791804.1 glycoside hydrolase family 97 catalytic domain-containing protein [Persicirhabdus sediminis]